ncbi:MAG TPA: DNA-3-methyladenine glycosylase [Nitrososphaerales archaeon]|nr:DNA-3-methyladenine glycosylase [Nitrososphaerales archaeon]
MHEPPLPRSFFERDTVSVAKDLLGTMLVRDTNGQLCSGRIVETEAYRGMDDPASHAFRGRTPRNSLMFGSGGRAYVYFIYGRNWCLNATTEVVGTPGAVLIRAIEPLEGLAFMMARRGRKAMGDLTNGPGKLTQALDITGVLNGANLTRQGPLFIRGRSNIATPEVVATKRIGIRDGNNYPWRFLIPGNPFVSRLSAEWA